MSEETGVDGARSYFSRFGKEERNRQTCPLSLFCASHSSSQNLIRSFQQS
ncbi:hypothetical protein [Rubritalea tangerina]